jgi:hypothetical protein
MTLTITIRLPAAPWSASAVPAPVAGPGSVHLPGRDGVLEPAGSLPAGQRDDAGLLRLVRTLLPLAEPVAMLVADAAGLGLVGQIVCATALRSARQVLAA